MHRPLGKEILRFNIGTSPLPRHLEGVLPDSLAGFLKTNPNRLVFWNLPMLFLATFRILLWFGAMPKQILLLRLSLSCSRKKQLCFLSLRHPLGKSSVKPSPKRYARLTESSLDRTSEPAMLVSMPSRYATAKLNGHPEMEIRLLKLHRFACCLDLAVGSMVNPV